MKVAIFSRVSTVQHCDSAQVEQLKALCQRSGWTIVRVYQEKVSGTKGPEERAALKQLLADARTRQFEKVVIWSIGHGQQGESHDAARFEGFT